MRPKLLQSVDRHQHGLGVILQCVLLLLKYFQVLLVSSFSKMTALAEHLCGSFSDFFTYIYIYIYNFLHQTEFLCVHLLHGTF